MDLEGVSFLKGVLHEMFLWGIWDAFCIILYHSEGMVTILKRNTKK
jgi:hypothetical protein